MKKTYITTMPDKAGAFLKASYIIAHYGGNMVRVNYNKAVDIHTLFIEVEASPDAHRHIEESLKAVGYLQDAQTPAQVLLIVLRLEDVAGAIAPILEVISSYHVNISYMSSQENGTGFQDYKMGLLLENPQATKSLLDAVSKLCEVQVLDYDVTEKVLDGTVFYISFANEMRRLLGLTQAETNEVIIQSNRIMQMLEAGSTPPLQTFEYIRKFAQFVVEHHGEAFSPVVTHCAISAETTMTLIQPPCGSNITILEYRDELLFIDCGFGCYRREMLRLLASLYPDFHKRQKFLALTHGDIDHTGFADIFDRIYMTDTVFENFSYEHRGEPNYREQYLTHQPYCILSKIITGYVPVSLERAVLLGKRSDDVLISPVGKLDFGDLQFEIFNGAGGHVRGETVYVCRQKKLVFTGDIFVNIHGFTKEQEYFNRLAPYLMTSVNVDSEIAKKERNLILSEYVGYTLYPAHGAPFLNSPR